MNVFECFGLMTKETADGSGSLPIPDRGQHCWRWQSLYHFVNGHLKKMADLHEPPKVYIRTVNRRAEHRGGFSR
jgi:hypothetical protein